MRLTAFILDNIEPILQEWVNYASTIFTAARKATLKELQNDAERMLIDIATDLKQAQSNAEQIAKSKGFNEVSQDTKASAAWTHGLIRMQQGFSVNDIMSEYRALRASVTKRWCESLTMLQPIEFGDLIRFNEAIDQALFESATSFVSARKHQQHLFETMISHSPDLCYILNLDGTIQYVNKAMLALYKKPTQEILGKVLYNFAMPSASEVHARIQYVCDTGKKYHGEDEFQMSSESKCIFESVYAPVFDESGIIEAVAVTSHDITTHKKNEEKFKLLLEAIPDSLVICNTNRQIIMANNLTEKLFGYTQDELISQKIELLMPNRYRTIHEKNFQSYCQHPRTRPMGFGLEIYGQHKDGREFPVEINLSSFQTEEGLLSLAMIRDSTDRDKIDETIAMLSAIVQFSDDAIIGKNLQGIIFSWNKGAEMLYGYTAAEAVGQSITSIFPPSELAEFDSIMHKIRLGEQVILTDTLRVHKNGKIIPVSVTISPIKNAQGKVIGASSSARDISPQKLIEKKLRHLAEHDVLTGLINRPLLDDRITHAIALAKRYKKNVAILFLDLDDFKAINDNYGHTTGDLLLCAAVKCISNRIRDVDTFARIGGDEFVLVLSEINREKDVDNIIKEIMNQFSKGFLIDDKKFFLTLSFGISWYPKDGVHSLIEKADAAMYYAKKHGKNSFKWFDNTLSFNDK